MNENTILKILPETYIQVLQLLRDHPSGITNRQILDAGKQSGYSLFKHITQISSCVYYMRAKNLLTTTDTRKGKINKITAVGLQSLKYTLGENEPAPEPEADKNSSETGDALTALADDIITGIQQQTDAEEIAYPTPPSDSGNVIELSEKFNSLMQNISNLIWLAMDEPNTRAIADKRLKLSVLERLEPLYNDEISAVLAAIRNDLEQM